jgi:hypothetical protein
VHLDGGLATVHSQYCRTEQLRATGEHDGQTAATDLDQLHQALEFGQSVPIPVMGLIDEPGNRFLQTLRRFGTYFCAFMFGVPAVTIKTQ